MTTLHLVRHAETVWHAENRYTGSSDVALSAAGHQQVATLARWAARTPLDAVYASTLTRAIETARPSATAAGVVLRTDARLREVDFGAGEGRTRAEMAAAFPEALAAFLAHPATSPLPNGEPGVEALKRAQAALDDVRAEHPDGIVLVVMHSTLLRLVLCSALGIDPEAYRAVFPTVGNCAITTLRLDRTTAALMAYNVAV